VTELVTLAVPCRSDEPALERTLDAALASWRHAAQASSHRLEVLVCVNGDRADEPRRALRAFATRTDAPLAELDLDAAESGSLPALTAPLVVAGLFTRRVGKSHAWNILRVRARAPVALFMDADVSFGREVFGRLLDALARHPEAALASGKTTCAPRPGTFETVMAAPYGVDFPNLSPQLYAARLTALPAALPEDLLEPEHWLELTLGHQAIARVPEAHVEVRLPGTLADFFRQRVRIEMGKVQLARQYPRLLGRGAAQPGARAALVSLGARGTARLAVYVGLRGVAHAIAWWRYRRGRTADVWRQAVTTKRWDHA
jgi:hypothetical protein